MVSVTSSSEISRTAVDYNAERGEPCLLLFLYTSSTPSTIDAMFCSLMLMKPVNVTVNSDTIVPLPVEETLQLSCEFLLSFRQLPVVAIRTIPEMWRDISRCLIYMRYCTSQWNKNVTDRTLLLQKE